MKYSGKVSARKGEAVTVEIVTDGTSYTIYDLNGGPTVDMPGHPSTPTPANGALQLDADPVEINWECNDTFDVLIPTSATIRLQASVFWPDFFRGDCLTTDVRISRGSETLFRGMIAPMSYTQQFVGVADILELNCIDPLSALQYKRYRNCGTTSTEWQSVAASASVRPLKTILEEQLSLVTSMQIEYRGVPLMKAGGSSALEGISVNEALFLGESEDDVWTAQEVVEEILRYLDLHIIQHNGKLVVFHWDEAKQGTPLEITGHNAWGSDHSLSMGEIFNRISLTCEMNGEEELIPDILDEDKLTSPFDGQQLFCTEYSSKDIEDSDDDTAGGLIDMVLGKGYPDVRGDAYFRRDWYMRFMQNPYWKFYQATDITTGTGNWDGTMPVNRDAALYYCGGKTPTAYQNKVLNELPMKRGAAIVAFESGKQEYKNSDSSVSNSRNKVTQVIIGVGGESATKPDDRQSNEAEGSNIADIMQAACPRAVYTGPSNGTALSPSDDDTTRYIVIDGKIALAPWYVGNPWRIFEYMAAQTENPTDFSSSGAAVFRFGQYAIANRVKMGDNDTRMLIRRYWQAQDYDDTPVSTGMPGYNQANASIGAGYDAEQADALTFFNVHSKELFTPFQNDEAGRFFKYEFSRKESGDYVSQDLCSKVDVLSCMLIVGDKCVVETGDGSEPEHYVWRTFKTRAQCSSMDEFLAQSFTLGFDPKLGDYLVGQEFDIANTVHYSRGIDAKGLAIPVRKSDAVSGQVRFIILGPYNLFWDNNVIYRHATLFRKEKFTPNGKFVLPFVNHIALSGLSIKVVSDNGGADPLEDRDLVYVSDTDESYVNEKDDLTFRITSALTAEERRRFGTRDTRSTGTAVDNATGLGVLSVYRNGDTAKPEQFYVDAAWRECHTGKPEVSQTVDEDRIAVSPFSVYSHPGIDGPMWPIGIRRNLRSASATLKLRKI